MTGRVKWFNNKAGYGFITITDGSRSGSDIFVHHSAVNVENQQYKYLVQGEYVEFDLVKIESDKHEWQASKVSGIRGGKLMCETRRDLKMARTEYKSTKQPEEELAPVETKMPRQRVATEKRKTTAPRARGEGPRDGEKKEWTLVTGRNVVPKARGRPPRQSSTALAESN
jgi:CspA family cold shock protein